MSKLTYTNKVALSENPSVAAINKVQDSDMNSIKNAVNQNGSYTTTTAGTSNGQYYCTIEGTLSSGDGVKVSIPTNTLTANASLSIDGGTTYYNIVDMSGNNISANGLAGRNIDLVFNGTSFVSNLEIYSTGEIKTNKIYNGKVVYRNWVSFLNPAMAIGSEASVAHNISNIDTVVLHYGWQIRSKNSTTRTTFFPSMTTGGAITNIKDINSTNVVIRSRDAWNAGGYYFEGWIEYTKTTN